MDREKLVKVAYAEGAFAALLEIGYEKTAAQKLAIKMAEDEGVGVLGGAGLGALGGLGVGAGGAALASLLMKKNLLKSIPGLSKQMRPGNIKSLLRKRSTMPKMQGKVLRYLAENPTAASAIGGGVGGLGLGALGGGLYGGLTD